MPLLVRESPKEARAKRFASSLAMGMKNKLESEEGRSHLTNIATKYTRHLGEKAQILLADPVPTIIYWTISSLPLPGLIDDTSSKQIVQEFFPKFNPPGFVDEKYKSALIQLGLTKYWKVVEENPALVSEALALSRFTPASSRSRLLPSSYLKMAGVGNRSRMRALLEKARQSKSSSLLAARAVETARLKSLRFLAARRKPAFKLKPAVI